MIREIFYDIAETDEIPQSNYVKTTTLPNSRERLKSDFVRTARRTLTVQEMKTAAFNVTFC
jgi:hypothetical protein